MRLWLCIAALSAYAAYGQDLLTTGAGRGSIASQPNDAYTTHWLTSYLATPNVFGLRYFTPDAHQGTGTTTENQACAVVPVAGTITDVRFYYSVAPGAGNSWTNDVRLDLASEQTCSVADPDVTCTITTDIAVAANECLSIGITGVSTPTASQVSWDIRFVPTDVNITARLANPTVVTTLSTTTTQYLAPYGNSYGTSLAPTRQILFPSQYLLSKWCARLTTAPGAGTSRTFTPQLDGLLLTTAAIIYSDASSGVQCYTFSPEIALFNMDVLNIQSTLSGAVAASSASFSIALKPQTNGDWIISGVTSGNLSTTVEHFFTNNGISASSTTEATHQLVAQNDFTVTGAASRLASYPGSSDSYEFVLRQNSADASTPFTHTIANGELSAYVTGGPFTPSAGGLLASSATPIGTPAANPAMFSLNAHSSAVGPGAGIATATADLFIDSESAADGTALTTAILNADTYGYGGTWTASGITGITTCAEDLGALRSTHTIRNQSYTGTGTKGYCYDHTTNPDQSVTYGGYWSSSITSAGFYWRTSLDGSTGTAHDMFRISGSNGAGTTTCVFQLLDNNGGVYGFRAHGTSPTAGTTYGTSTVVTPSSTIYWVTQQFNGSSGQCNVNVYDGTTFTLVATSTAVIDTGTAARSFIIGDDSHGGFGAFETVYSEILVNWTTGTFPLGTN